MNLAGKHPSFVVKEQTPLNGGTPVARLVRQFLTPADHFFIRSHGAVPPLEPDAHRVSISGMVRHARTYTPADLQREFPSATVVAALECAGNRRDELIALRPVPGELPWEAEAVGNAEWAGVPLAAVLDAAQVLPGAAHVVFTGVDRVTKDGRSFGFGGSVPLSKATRPEVLLAYTMNGEPLRPEHGAPLRVVVPGYIGARSVKWVSEITVQRGPSDNYFQARAYKLFPPHVDAETADWNAGAMLGEVPVNSVIASPADRAIVPAGPLAIRGYALSGRGRIAGVEISTDGGRTWQMAGTTVQASEWSWCLWDLTVDLSGGDHELAVRARDTAGTTQPEHLRDVWNFKGYVNNAWHRVRITAT
ncbi:MAG: sulfite oxidase [bacterium]